MTPFLPSELVNHILEYLWDNLHALLSCSLTCHRFRDLPACRHVRVMRPSHTMYLQSGRDFDFVCRILSSQSTRGFYLQDGIKTLLVGGASRQPLIHTLPFRISTSHLPSLEVIEIFNADWTICRPHPTFFIRLKRLTSVTRLELNDCCFHHAHELRKLTDAFPHLTTLHLDKTTCSKLATSEHLSRHSRNMEELYISSIGLDDYGRSILAICTSYSTLTRLHVYVQCFCSFYEFQGFVCHFSRLKTLYVSSPPGRPHIPTIEDAHSVVTSGGSLSPPFSLNSLGAYQVPRSFAEPLLAWLAMGSAVTTLEQLVLHPPEDPGATVGLTVDHFMETAALELRTVYMTVFVPGHVYPLISPVLSSLDLAICVAEDTPAFDWTITTLTNTLSSIRSAQLKTVELHIAFNFNEFPCSDAAPLAQPATAREFRLTDQLRPIFSPTGPKFGVLLYLNGEDDIADPVLDAALYVLKKFFAPWCDCGMLEVIMPRLYHYQAEREGS